MIKRSLKCSEADASELGMLENNRIDGLVPMELYKSGDTVFCAYHEDGFSVLENLVSSESGNLYLYAVIYALAAVGKALREHFLDENRLSLLPGEIFVDEAAGKVLFLYDPVKKEFFGESLQRLMEYFLKVINPAEERRILFLYGLYRKSREEHVLPETLLQYWKTHAPDEKPSGESCAETAFPDDACGYPDETPYSEPGLYLPKNRAFEAWRKSRTADRQDIPESTASDPGREEALSELYPEETVSGEKYRAFLKKYGYGLVIAAILLIGILLFFLI